MHTYMSIGNKARRIPMAHHTRVMRFTFEMLDDGSESFSAHWIDDGDGVVHRCYFQHVSRFQAWLLDDQRYSEREADALIERLRGQQSPVSHAANDPMLPQSAQ